MSRLRWRSLFLALGVLLLAACSGSSTPANPAATSVAPTRANGSSAASSSASPAASAAAKAAVVPGGTLKVAFRQDIVGGFDPATSPASAEAWESNLMYEALVGQNPDFSPRPLLAQSWEASVDGLTWTFHLRQGVKFTDGSDFNAYVVKFNFDRIFQSSPVKNVYAPYLTADGVQVVDANTVNFHLTKRYGLFPILLTVFPGLMVSQKAVTSGVDLTKTPVGTGPFTLDSFSAGSQITFTKNPNYWAKDAAGNQLPYLDKMVWQITPDATQRVNALRAGEVDLAFALDSAEYTQVKSSADVNPAVFAAGRLAGIQVSVSKPPFNNPDVRKAMSMAIDRDTMFNAALRGLGEPSYGVFPKNSIYYDKSVTDPNANPNYAFNVQQAKSLLTKAGYPNGIDLPQVKVLVAVEYPDVVRAAEILLQQLQTAGIRLGGIETCNIPQCSARWTSGDFDFTIIHWPNSGDPLILLSNLYHSNGANNEEMWPSTPQLDAALDAAIAESDPTKRVALAQQAQLLALNAGPARIELFYLAVFDAYSKKVGGYDLLPNGLQRRWDTVGFLR